jgi:hypothetical protein
LDPEDTTDTVDKNAITLLNADAATRITVSGEADTTLGFQAGDTVLSILDASGLSGNFTMTAESYTTNGLQFQGAEGVDTYLGTVHGDTVNAGTGQDSITLGAAAKRDMVILQDGDALLSETVGSETYSNFTSGEDNIYLGSFGFTDDEQSGLVYRDNMYDQIAALTNGSDDIADFFSLGVVDRGVAVSSNGTNTYVLIDANHNGDLDVETDLIIELTGTASVVLGDFSF